MIEPTEIVIGVLSAGDIGKGVYKRPDTGALTLDGTAGVRVGTVEKHVDGPACVVSFADLPKDGESVRVPMWIDPIDPSVVYPPELCEYCVPRVVGDVVHLPPERRQLLNPDAQGRPSSFGKENHRRVRAAAAILELYANDAVQDVKYRAVPECKNGGVLNISWTYADREGDSVVAVFVCDKCSRIYVTLDRERP
jgi:hypothetical protein